MQRLADVESIVETELGRVACRGPNCSNTKFCEAHIIPKGFGRLIRKDEGPNIKLEPHRIGEANPQLGDYDPSILCADCDNILGKNDDYAIDVCKRFAEANSNEHHLFEFAEIDCERFSIFVLSILWRASISKRPTFSDVALGAYEDIARDVIFGIRPLTDLPAFELIVSKFRSRYLDPSGINYYPVRWKFKGLNTYGMCLAGFRILAKLDNRRLASEWTPLIINRTMIFRGAFLEFEECNEFAGLAEIIRNNERSARPFE